MVFSVGATTAAGIIIQTVRGFFSIEPGTICFIVLMLSRWEINSIGCHEAAITFVNTSCRLRRRFGNRVASRSSIFPAVIEKS